LAADDTVVCQLPHWHFDLQALEDLHHRLEDLQAEHESLWVRYSRTQDALASLSNVLESGTDEKASSADEVPQAMPVDSRRSGPRDVHQLQHQLALNERKQQGMKAKVVALRQEFTQLIQTIGGGVADATLQGMHSGPELPWMAHGEISDAAGAQSPPPRRAAGETSATAGAHSPPPRRAAGDRSLSPSSHAPQPSRVDAPGGQRGSKATFNDRSPSPQQRSPQLSTTGEVSNGQRTCSSPSSLRLGGSPGQKARTSQQSSHCSLRPGTRHRGAVYRRGLVQSSIGQRAAA
jgi:hypothetical protein